MNIFPDPLPPDDRLRIGVVSRLYRVLLGRTADVAGLTAIVQRLREGIPLETVLAEALRSEEFVARHTKPAQCADDVDAMYHAAYEAAPPEVDRTLPLGVYAAHVLTAAENLRPSRISDILFAEGLDPADGSDYRFWLADFHTPNLPVLAAETSALSDSIAVSLVLSGDWASSAALAATLESISGQICDRSELVIAGGRRFRAAAARLIPAAARVAPTAEPGAQAPVAQAATIVACGETNPAALLNAALPHCRGRFILPLQSGTRLAPDAVWHIAQAAEDESAAALLLDYDRIDSACLRQSPTLHAGWDPEVALCRTDWAPGLALDAALARGAGEALEAAGSAAYAELALRVIEAAGHERVKAVPRPLLQLPIVRSTPFSLPAIVRQWRETRSWARVVSARLGNGAGTPRLALPNQGATHRTGSHQGTPNQAGPNRVGSNQAGSNYDRSNQGGSNQGQSKWFGSNRAGPWRVIYPLPRRSPLVSVIIPTRDNVDLLRCCVDGLLNRTRYPALEIVLLDNRSSEPETLRYLEEIGRQTRVRVLRDDAAFNWGAINNHGVRNARGEIILLLNNDTDVLEPNWLDEMVAQALRPEIGAVGAKLLYHDRTVQHAGLVLGPDGHAFHRFRHVPDTTTGYRNEVAMVRSVSAVTGACLAMRRSVFDEVGGIEEAALAVTWSDVDLCYRVREAGYRVICTPFTRLLHLELATRGADDTPERAARAECERQFMMKKWPSLANEDPFFNPNIRLAEGETRLAAPPRLGWPSGSQGNAA